MSRPEPPRIRLAKTLMGEEEVEAVRSVLFSGVLTNGPRTAEFETRFARLHQVEHAVAFANGTVALAAMLLGNGIGPGDEVIVPSLTFISTATSVLHVGATPVFADVTPDTFTLDPDDVQHRLTSRTRAIVAVHYAGQAADMAALAAVAADAGVLLLEDAAQAHGAAYRGTPVGGLGTAGMFSFTPTKNITTGEGGLVTTDDAELASRLRLLRNHGQTSLYRHTTLGYNWRMTEMQAAIGCVQLERLPGIIARKADNARRLGGLLADVPGLRTPYAPSDRTHVYMLYTVTLDARRDAVRDALLAGGLEVRQYFPPAHRQPVFAMVQAPVELPVTDYLSEHILSLPFHGQLTAAELEDVAANVHDAVLRA